MARGAPIWIRQRDEEIWSEIVEVLGLDKGATPDIGKIETEVERRVPYDPSRGRRNNAKKWLKKRRQQAEHAASFQFYMQPLRPVQGWLPGMEWPSITPTRLLINDSGQGAIEGYAPPEFFEALDRREKEDIAHKQRVNAVTEFIATHYRKWYDEQKGLGVNPLFLTWPNCARQTLRTR